MGRRAGAGFFAQTVHVVYRFAAGAPPDDSAVNEPVCNHRKRHVVCMGSWPGGNDRRRGHFFHQASQPDANFFGGCLRLFLREFSYVRICPAYGEEPGAARLLILGHGPRCVLAVRFCSADIHPRPKVARARVSILFWHSRC